MFSRPLLLLFFTSVPLTLIFWNIFTFTIKVNVSISHPPPAFFYFGAAQTFCDAQFLPADGDTLA